MLKLRDIMTRDVITVAPDLGVRGAMELFTDHHVSGAPVLEGRRVVGVISGTDLMSFAASLEGVQGIAGNDDALGDMRGDEGRDESWAWDDDSGPAAAYFTGTWSGDQSDVQDGLAAFTRSGRSALDAHTVAEAMTAHVCALPSTASVAEAAEFMRKSAIHRVLVIDGDDLMGIVSTMDITRAVAEHKLVSRTYVFGEPREIDPREQHTSLGSKRVISH